ncbi:hypothetical protein EV195_104171 [Tenacibaculum skagerrakense]|uniref:Uncharacterized protein n=1 Tax=Tenacibaculum skagerrakense TaxID=186571 RepID=A0A4R2NUF9_9FLAO|nr:hypothetical protein [Tenacibaculum skagerrakense]TCP25138.1 hypothetical protein EV195_104171 [Tenacibaculum skagerrakense]
MKLSNFILGVIVLILVYFSFAYLNITQEKNVPRVDINPELELYSYGTNIYFINDYLEILSNMKIQTKNISENSNSTDEIFLELGKVAAMNNIKLNKWENDENKIIRETVESTRKALVVYDEISRINPGLSGFESQINTSHKYLINSAEKIIELKLTETDKSEILKTLNENTSFDFEEINSKIESEQPVKGWDVGYFLLMMKVTGNI